MENRHSGTDDPRARGLQSATMTSLRRISAEALADSGLDTPAVLDGLATELLARGGWRVDDVVARNAGLDVAVWVFARSGALPCGRITVALPTYVGAMRSGDWTALHSEAARVAGPAAHPPADLRYFTGSIPADTLSDACRGMIDATALPGTDHADASRTANVWIGPPGSSVGLHWDGRPGYLLQLQGSKQVTLVDPTQRRWLYPEPNWEGPNSPVDVFDPDLTAHPRFAHAETERFDLRPGDGLLIPAGWWHALRAADEAVSVNVWFRPHRPG